MACMPHVGESRSTRVCLFFFLVRVGAQLGLPHMMTVEIKIPNRMVGLGKVYVGVCVSACVRMHEEGIVYK